MNKSASLKPIISVIDEQHNCVNLHNSLSLSHGGREGRRKRGREEEAKRLIERERERGKENVIERKIERSS